MYKPFKLLACMIVLLALSACIKVELKDEREISKFYEIVLITNTPEGGVISQPSATPPPATLPPSPIPTETPVPTETPLLTPTPVTPSQTPTPLAVVNQRAWCRRGPGTVYPGIDFLSTGEQVTLLGRNTEATWWLVQKSGTDQTCWASSAVIQLPDDAMGVAVVSAPPIPAQSFSQPTATQRARQRPPKPGQGTPAGPTETPNPYPGPYPEP